MINVILANIIALCVYVFVLSGIWGVVPADFNLLYKQIAMVVIAISPLVAYLVYKINFKKWFYLAGSVKA